MREFFLEVGVLALFCLAALVVYVAVSALFNGAVAVGHILAGILS